MFHGSNNSRTMNKELERLKLLMHAILLGLQEWKVDPSEKADKVLCKSINPEFPPFEVSLSDVYAVYRVLMCMSLK